MKRIFVHLTLILIAIFLFSSSGFSERGIKIRVAEKQRLALVIGNVVYKTGALNNPVNDANDMAQALKKMGFEVISRTNAGYRTMEDAVHLFGRKLRNGGVGLFYFAGHGIQLKGRNYLLPIDAQIESESDVKFEAVDAGRILGKMEDAGNELNIVILDACRNNPFACGFRSSNPGLAKMDAPKGSFIAYATAPGSVAADGTDRNGLYTKYLLKHMNTTGLKVEEVFKKVRNDVMRETGDKQVPWESSSLRGDFYFISVGKVQITEKAKDQKKKAAISKQEEMLFWESIKDSNDPGFFEAYLKKYPNGAFVTLARLKLGKLRGKQYEQKGKGETDKKKAEVKSFTSQSKAQVPKFKVSPEDSVFNNIHVKGRILWNNKPQGNVLVRLTKSWIGIMLSLPKGPEIRTHKDGTFHFKDISVPNKFVILYFNSYAKKWLVGPKYSSKEGESVINLGDISTLRQIIMIHPSRNYERLTVPAKLVWEPIQDTDIYSVRIRGYHSGAPTSYKTLQTDKTFILLSDFEWGYYSYYISALNKKKEEIAKLTFCGGAVQQFILPDLDLEKKFKTFKRTAKIKRKSPDGEAPRVYWKPVLGVQKIQKISHDDDAMFLPVSQTVKIVKCGEGWCMIEIISGFAKGCVGWMREEDLSIF